MTDAKSSVSIWPRSITARGQRPGLAWLEKDFKEHSAELQYIMEPAQFEQLRHEPRGTDLIRRMGLNP